MAVVDVVTLAAVVLVEVLVVVAVSETSLIRPHKSRAPAFLFERKIVPNRTVKYPTLLYYSDQRLYCLRHQTYRVRLELN